MASEQEMLSTIADIDSFERRLQLKTSQEGLKHKAAAVSLTPNLVEDSMNGGLEDYKAKYEVPKLEAASAAPPDAEASVAEQSSDSLPKIHPPDPNASLSQSTVLDDADRLVVLTVLHGSNLEGPDMHWRTGVNALVCNPFCIIQYGPQLAKGKIVTASRNPVFKDSFVLHPPQRGDMGEILLSVYSQEEGSEPDTLVGTVRINIDILVTEKFQEAIEDGAHKWYNLSGGKGGALHVNLKITSESAMKSRSVASGTATMKSTLQSST